LRSLFVCLAICTASLPGLIAQNNTMPSNSAAQPGKPVESASVLKKSENLNAALVSARKTTSEKRYADSEALMQAVTRDNPNLILPWVELGLAQLGLKKYEEAENSFKTALGIDPASLQRAHADDFYLPDGAPPGTMAPTATRVSRNTVGSTMNSGENRTPDIQGVCWASLGEIYAHEKKFPEATTAFDTAVKAFSSSAATYRHNETVLFFQAGNSDGQLAAANEAIALEPTRAANYYFKAQALVSKATLDPKTQKMILPEGCGEAYQKYLDLDPNGPYSADAKGILAAAGVPLKPAKK
jgi:tetratricopeptide (TPR) repeat protein